MKICFENYQNDYAHLNGCRNMNLKKIDLCRHTMQVGYRNRASFITTTLYKHLELFFMVMANVDYVNDNLVLKDEYFALDQSEKACISYQIGQGLTKAVAEKYFKVPWVAHVKTMKKMNYNFEAGCNTKLIIYPNEKSGKEPDLIGFDKSNKVHIFESKGSSLPYMKINSIQKAINQASNYIGYTDPLGNNRPFSTRNACLFNFSPFFHGEIIDPPDYSGDEENCIGLLHCLYEYYNIFLHNRRQLETIEEFGKQWNGYIISFDEQKYFWGINSSYKEFLQEELINYKLNTADYFVPLFQEKYAEKVERILIFLLNRNFMAI